MGRYINLILISLWGTIVTPAYGYPTPVDVDGYLHVWPISSANPHVYYEYYASEAEMETYLETILDEAAARWSSVSTSSLKLERAVTDNLAQITVYFDSSIENGATSAGYSVFDETEDGEPKHCSIHIAVNPNVATYDLQKTVLHELGHCVGLAHSLVPNSIMSYQLEQNSFALALDDRAAISRLYPVDGQDTKLPPGCAIGQPRQTRYNLLIFIAFTFFPAVLSFLSRRLGS